MSRRIAFIAEESEPGPLRGSVVTLDSRILVDDYDPKHPETLWYCDVCDEGYPITAEFIIGPNGIVPKVSVTLCAVCLQNGLNGIAYSRANPVGK